MRAAWLSPALEARREQILHAQAVLDAWEDAVERTWIDLDRSIRSSSPDVATIKYRHRRARNQAEAASNHLQVLRDRWERERPGGGNHGARRAD